MAWDTKESHFATCVSVYYKTLCVVPSSNDSNKRQSPRRVVIDFFNMTISYERRFGVKALNYSMITARFAGDRSSKLSYMSMLAVPASTALHRA